VTVTASATGQSRNGDCEYCEVWLPKIALGYEPRFGEVFKWVSSDWTHCTTCHSRDHNACEGCGECLGAYDTGVPNPSGYLRTWKNYRRDKRYCSGACRQRAYRRRRNRGRPA
jgi:hypothetical protein